MAPRPGRGGIGVQPECLAEIRESCDRAGGEPIFELVKSGLAVFAPMKERFLPGKGKQGSGNSGKTLHIPAVVAG